jgi:hypothetical protein
MVAAHPGASGVVTSKGANGSVNIFNKATGKRVTVAPAGHGSNRSNNRNNNKVKELEEEIKNLKKDIQTLIILNND